MFLSVLTMHGVIDDAKPLLYCINRTFAFSYFCQRCQTLNPNRSSLGTRATSPEGAFQFAQAFSCRWVHIQNLTGAGVRDGKSKGIVMPEGFTHAKRYC